MNFFPLKQLCASVDVLMFTLYFVLRITSKLLNKASEDTVRKSHTQLLLGILEMFQYAHLKGESRPS